MPCVTITFRPPKLNMSLKEFTDLVVNAKVTEYFTCAESADEEDDEPNHYHAYIITSQHQDAVRKRLKKKTGYNKPALKVGKHSDPQYLLGYVQKEGLAHFTNIDDKVRLDEALAYYNELHPICEDNKGKDLTSDNIYRMLLGLHKDVQADKFNFVIYAEFIRRYDKHISFGTYSKINLKSLKGRINIMLGSIELG